MVSWRNMFSYHFEGNSTCTTNNNTLISSCYYHGSCKPNPFLDNQNSCDCNLYYNPLKHCETNLFQDIPYTSQLSYVILGHIIFGIFFLLFLLEIIGDFHYLAKAAFKTMSTIIKIIMLVFCSVMITSISLFAQGMVYQTTQYAFAEYVMRTIAKHTFGMCYMLCNIIYLDMIITAKKLGEVTTLMKIVRIGVIVLVSVGVPISFIFNIMSILDFHRNIIDPLQYLMAGVTIFIPMIVNVVYTVIVFKWYNKLPEERRTRKLKMLHTKTIILTVSTCLLIVTLAFILGSTVLPDQLIDVIMIRSWLTLILMSFMIGLLWSFIQNYALRSDYKPFLMYITMWTDKNLTITNISSGIKKRTNTNTSMQLSDVAVTHIKSDTQATHTPNSDAK